MRNAFLFGHKKGPSAESEKETKAVVGALNAKLGDWIAFFNIHSFGNWWLTPWGENTNS